MTNGKSSLRFTPEPFLTFSSFLGEGQNAGISQLFNNQEIKRYLFYGYGRVALLEGLRMLAVGGGSNILLPSYICEVAVEPIRELGIEPRFYEVSDHLQPDVTQITNIIDKKTRGVMVVNYFGFPAQNLEEIQNICKKFDFFLIEDNAHGFLSLKGPRLLGTFGDIGISSIWKYLPIPNGAVLFVNKDSLIENKRTIAEMLTRQNQYPPMGQQYVYLYIANSLLNNLETRYRFPANLVRSIYRKLFLRKNDSKISEFNYKVRISEVSLRIAQGLNLEKICLIIRQNYDFWLDELSQRKGLDIIFNDLTDGICPLVFPLLVEDVETFSREMLDKGIPSRLWPPLPKEVLDNVEYPIANYLARHMLTLPVHQNLDLKTLERAFRK